MTLPLLSLLLPIAQAQEAINAAGYPVAAQDGDLTDLISLWRAERQQPGAYGLSGVFDYASRPLVQNVDLGDGEVGREALVGDLFGLNLIGAVGVHERVGLGVALPVWLASGSQGDPQGSAFGDLRLTAPIGLWVPSHGRLALSAIPLLDLPTGSDSRLLGNPGVGGGLATALAATWGAWSVDGNLGVLAAPGVDLVNLEGGPKLLAAAGGSFLLTEALAVRAEANLRPSLTPPNLVAATESPGEAALSVRGKVGDVLGWTAGLGTALTRGVGASPFRAYLGVGGTWGKGDDDPDGDGLRGSADTCPRDPETVNGWRDEDGCPDELAQVVLVARDPRGAAVPEVRVEAADRRGVTDAEGRAVLDGLSPADPIDLRAQHPHYATWSANAQPLSEGVNTFEATLSLLPGSVRVAVHDVSGRPIPGATVRFLGESERDPEPVGPTGAMSWALPPGDWTALATAEGYGTERAEFTLVPGVFEPHEITLVLAASKVTVKEDVVAIHEKVNFDFDKAVVLPESLPLLRQVANTLLNHPELELIEIAGHTDRRGSTSYNLKLSQRRVESVMTYLIAEGVDPARLQAKGYGATQPLQQGDSEEAYAANRRVEFRILRSRKTRPETE